MATADSKVNNNSWVIIKKEIKIEERELPVLPNKVNNKWPAIMFAESRIAKVPGRIIFLIVSIITIKGIRMEGVPWGIKWINICWVLFNHPYNIKLNHKGKAKDKVNVICLVLVKIYGNNPKKLLNKINLNKEINIKVVPLKLEIPNSVLNSLWRIINILFQNKKIREGINQNSKGKKRIPKIVLIQFKDKFKIFVDGSKIENKFIIIFS